VGGAEFSLNVTNDNYDQLVDGVTYYASAMESKEFTFDIKELMGEVNLSIPWEQGGFLQAFTEYAIEPIVTVNIYSYNTSTTTQKLVFRGFVNSFKAGKSKIDLGCLSFVEQCRDSYPKITLSRHCCNRLFDETCGLLEVDYQILLSLTGVSSDGLTLTGTGPTSASGYYTYGRISQGVSSRYIVSHEYDSGSNSIYLMHPCPRSWAAGQWVTLHPGCDKSTETCRTKYNNFTSFLGFPYAPYESIRYTGLRSESIDRSKK
jgi:uncharacterized phage protein (TIGR02218 family)